MIKEAIILAGGLGTRLRSAVPDLPKCMAPVAGKPFLSYVINYLLSQGIEQIIFSLGYKHEYIEEFLRTDYPVLQHKISIESEPLGTGGAIQLACKQAEAPVVAVMNGDTMFTADLRNMFEYHSKMEADCTIALKRMLDFDRYGVVGLDLHNRIISFQEKQYYQVGLINGGVYMLQVKSLLGENLPEKFSFEKDYLERYYTKQRIFGLVEDTYFIDIGIPEDYQRAQHELASL